MAAAIRAGQPPLAGDYKPATAALLQGLSCRELYLEFEHAVILSAGRAQGALKRRARAERP